MLSLNFGVFSEQLATDFNKLVSLELNDLQRRLLEHHEIVLAAAEVAFNRKMQDIKDSAPSAVPKLAPRASSQSASPLKSAIPDEEEEEEYHGDEGDASPFILNLDEHEYSCSGLHETNEEAASHKQQKGFNDENKMYVDVDPMPVEVVCVSADRASSKVRPSAVQFQDDTSKWSDEKDLCFMHKWSADNQAVFEGLRHISKFHRQSVQQEVVDLEDWQVPLLKTFFDLDSDDSGSLSTDELRAALLAAGVPQARLQKLVRLADKDCSGDISLKEWIEAVKKCGENSDMAVLANRLKTVTTFDDTDEKDGVSRFMLKPQSPLRIACDSMILCFCMYIATVLPMEVAWEDSLSVQASNVFSIIGRCINYLFMFDIILNFRTGYYKPDGELVMNSKKAAKRYLRSWFLFDAASSFPFEDASNVFTNLEVIKVMKLGKLLRVVKLMKLQSAGFGLAQHLVDDVLHSKLGRLLNRRCGIFLQMILVCHWLACGMKVVADGWLGIDGGLWSEYLATLYWAMQTLTTVGYGDMTPQTDEERAYCIFAMVIGGAFYGYVVGALTSLVSSSDLNASAYWDRMDLLEAWLSHHNLPKSMKKSLRSFFESFMQSNAALNDADIWQDLSPELRRSVGEYLIPDNVKNNPLFDGMDTGAVVQLQSILRTLVAPSGSVVTTESEVGTAMYVIDSGLLEMRTRSGVVHRLGPGQSFGEEVLLGFFDCYEYTVKVLDKAQLQMILESDLLTAFQLRPRQLHRMRQNALELNPQWEEQVRRTTHYWDQNAHGHLRQSVASNLSQPVSRLSPHRAPVTKSHGHITLSQSTSFYQLANVRRTRFAEKKAGTGLSLS